jgi:hypothetical protein
MSDDDVKYLLKRAAEERERAAAATNVNARKVHESAVAEYERRATETKGPSLNAARR